MSPEKSLLSGDEGPVQTQRAETFGPYVLYEAIARGGMATVHTARLVGAEGFSRLVAAKRLHPQYAEDPEFVTMLHDEARIASKIHHPNVVPVLDVVVSGTEVILVQEYVHGVSLAALMRAASIGDKPFPVGVVSAIVTGVLAGLHAAHEAKDELGSHLGIIHRDVSPQNVMVSVDGVPRLLDFGIAKATNRSQHTRQGFMKGKMGYMAPEQLRMEPVTRRVDLYAAGVLLWELLVNKRLYDRTNESAFISDVLSGALPSPLRALDARGGGVTVARRDAVAPFDQIVTRAMACAPENRFRDAAEMLEAVLRACPPASPTDVERWVRTTGMADLDRREKMVAANEESWRSSSRISIAMPTLGSGIQLSALAPRDDAVSATVPTPIPQSAAPPRAESGGSLRFLPWALSGGLLVLLSVVVATLVVQRTAASTTTTIAPATAEARDVPAATAALPAPAAATIADAPDAANAAPRNAQGAAPVHTWRPPPRSAPPSPAPPSRASSPTSASATVDPAPNDCNPPFYFSGSRKVFKPNCL